jgi:hypothetical protein
VPDLDRFYRENNTKIDLTVVVEEKPSSAASYLSTHSFSPPVVYDDESTSVASQYGVNSLPTIVVLGTDGAILARYEGESAVADLRKLLDSSL